ncbi:MBOAT family O-acyltransferase [Mangrovibacterium diazotrophicum]|uniref:D-alanyl-lipoteichoic acid acyltransferase DltB (MBOAT superfamily) n=1 Tax=Mangrovibacterium diazotrophicum TaxID=1261403 RepID=A0A419W7T8_9BACT|nr:MBOAT family O-acyltransferase [Mangrovibacterium diazotrophicum]RKD91490.1 D-alanyl-lipoteichoic acid acyltransferase DltB (MBOAT superfamily) [Mangrovibacterium diazotrophicum]
MEKQLTKILEQLIHYQEHNPLFYTKVAFWIAFAITLAFYSLFYRKSILRNSYLLLISWYIYYQMNGAFLSLLIFSCLANYGFGRLIDLHRKNRFWLIFSVSFNLLLLIYFKYTYFFTETINNTFHTDYQVFNWLGWFLNQITDGMADVHSIVLPIGISFYTFQAISYLSDVRTRKVEAVRNPIDFSFYLSFFPQLVAGPIVRAAAFIPQLYQKYRLSNTELSHAAFLILKGLFKKMVVADFLALNFVDRIFDAPGAYSGLENLLGVYGYSIQIYCDFSGYTDIAIGLALILGYKIPVNFNAPYTANGLSDFWHRWHISLSLWLRDYLYIPLGGNRKGKFRTHLNLIVTMLLGGLWHGASWRFIIWGGIHGVGLSVEKMIQKFRKSKSGPSSNKWLRVGSILLTFQLVSLAWIFFRAPDQETIYRMFYQFREHFIPQLTSEGVMTYLPTLGMLLLGFLLIWFPFDAKEKIRGWFIRQHFVLQVCIAAAVVLVIQYVSTSDIQPFIYFRF